MSAPEGLDVNMTFSGDCFLPLALRMIVASLPWLDPDETQLMLTRGEAIVRGLDGPPGSIVTDTAILDEARAAISLAVRAMARRPYWEASAGSPAASRLPRAPRAGGDPRSARILRAVRPGDSQKSLLADHARRLEQLKFAEGRGPKGV